MEEPYGLPRKLLAIGSEGGLDTNTKVLYGVLCGIFVCGSGLASGLTLGLMSLDSLEMKVLLRSGTPKQQRHAKTILPVIADPHWLLVTLLLCNAACFEALPLFLDALINPVGAILISVTLILLFGEILPQAVCARHGLAIGAALGWPVRFFMYLTSPISWPLARALDWLLGEEGADVFKRHELKALVDLHGTDEGLGGKLSANEIQIICGALDLTNKIAYSSMTSLENVVMLSTEQRIDRATISLILASGHSRLPVYTAGNRSNIIGLILVKELLAYAFPHHTADGGHDEDGVEVSALKLRPIPRLPANTRCYDMLKLFQTGRAHMVLLTQPDPEAVIEATEHSRPVLIPPTAAVVSPATHSQAPEDADGGSGETNRGSNGTDGGKKRSTLEKMSKALSRQSRSSTTSSSSSNSNTMVEEVEVVPQLEMPGEPIGIITIEDVLEELMGQEILDETDHFADNECTQPVDEEVRAKLAQKLPERLRNVVLGSGVMGVTRRTSRGVLHSGAGALGTPGGAGGPGDGSNCGSRTNRHTHGISTPVEVIARPPKSAHVVLDMALKNQNHVDTTPNPQDRA